MSLKYVFVNINGSWDDSTNYIGGELTVVSLKEYNYSELAAAIATVLDDRSALFNIYGLAHVSAMAKTMRLPIKSDSTLTYYVQSFTSLKPPETPCFWVVRTTRENLFEVHTSNLQDAHDMSPPNNKGVKISPATSESNTAGPHTPEVKPRLHTSSPTTPGTHVCDILRRAVIPEPGKDIQPPSCKRKLDYLDMNEGELYRTKRALREKLDVNSAISKVEFRITHSDRKRFFARCTIPSCAWSLRAYPVCQSSDYFEVRKHSTKHTCIETRVEPLRRRSKCHVLAEIVDKKLRADGVCSPAALQKAADSALGVTLNYSQAHRGVVRGIERNRGNPDESYYHLIGYSYLIQKLNPGTHAVVHTDDSHTFRYSFMALGVCIQAFRNSLRPIIAVDGTILTGKRGGTLLVAVGVDANEQNYPIAFGIVDSENNEACTWFFRELRKALEPDEEILFVSDRSGAINAGLSTVFPESEHVFCVYHLSNNLKKYSRGVSRTFLRAALSYNDSDFNTYMAKLEDLNPKAAKEIRELGVELWARVKARKPRFSMMTTNPAESFNSTLKPAKKLPPVLLMDFIRRTLAEWFVIRKKSAEDWNGELSRKATEIIGARNELAISFRATCLGEGRYEVNESGCHDAHEVNLEERTCSCGRFQMEFLPCLHALAVIRTKKSTTNFSFCGLHWRTSEWRSAYQGTIVSPLTLGRWDLPQDILSRRCLHPDFKCPAGRPKHDRYRAWSEIPKPPANQQRRCSKCGAEGHYRTTCSK